MKNIQSIVVLYSLVHSNKLSLLHLLSYSRNNVLPFIQGADGEPGLAGDAGAQGAQVSSTTCSFSD